MVEQMCDQDKRFLSKTLEEQKIEEEREAVRQATLKLMDNPVELAKVARIRKDLRKS